MTKLFRCIRVMGIATGVALALSTFAAAAEPESFSVVLLPDTQYYSEKASCHATYGAQTRWIRERAEADNIRFVIHLGDLVNTAEREYQWKIADAAHKVLDGVVPYSVVPGNHDMDHAGGKLTRSTKFYDEYFPPSRFKKHPWYGGCKDGRNTNNYCFFEGGGMKFMVLSLEFAPSDEAVAWASKIVKAHPNHHVIVATHYYLRDDDEGRGNRTPRPYDLDGCNGEELWNKFVRRHPNIFMVVCGHIAGVDHQTSVNDAGGKVHEILCDYQVNDKAGGNGWLQTLRFVPAEKKIYVRAYSPTLKKTKQGENHTYTLEWNLSTLRAKKAG